MKTDSNEKLGTIGVGSRIGHREKIFLVVLLSEVLVGKFLAVDRLSAGTLQDTLSLSRKTDRRRLLRCHG